MKSLKAILFAAALALPVSVSAAAPQVWELSEFDDFLSGSFEGLSLDKEGRLTLAPALTELFESEEAVAWSVAVGPDGAIFLGTGHEGAVYRVAPDGKAEEFWKAPEIEVFALVAGADGTLYAGTAPEGKIYAIDSKGQSKELFNPEEKYIWSMAMAPDGRHLFVATGDEGKIYRVALDGEGEVWFESGQRHAVALAFDPQGRLLVGTDPNGILYRVDGKGQAFALYDADQPEIRSIRVSPNGEIFFASMGGAMSVRDQTTQTVQAAQISLGGAASSGSNSNLGAQAPTVNYGVETSSIFRLVPNDSVIQLWSSKEEDALGLALDPNDSSKLLFITGNNGRLYRIDRSGDRLELLTETERRQATEVEVLGQTALIAAAHGGALSRLEASPAEKGEYLTGVRDTGAISKWGRLSWEGEGRIVFQTRTGNSSQPDAAWSDWSAPIETTGGGPIASPPARYIQYKAVFEASADAAPMLERTRLSYLPQNQPPTISAVTVRSEQAEAKAKKASNGSSSSSSASYSITVTASPSGNVASSASSTQEQTLDVDGGRRLKISWTANDPDGDDLLAAVEFRGEGETSWKLLEDRIEDAELTIDRDALADGRYRFRVRVSDAPANPPADARTAERISAPVLMDRTPPTVTLLERLGDAQSGYTVRFEATDAASAVALAEYSVNAGAWTPVRSDDGIADGPAEAFTVRLQGLEAGEHLLTLRVRDRAGNTGLGKALLP